MPEKFQPSVPLEYEHREIDEGLLSFRAGLEAGEWRRDVYTPAAGELRRHIYIEEEFLFPELRSAGYVGPVLVMVREHGEIWRVLDDIEEAMESGDFDAAILSCDAAMETLLGHNVKEETILYPASDEVLGLEEASRLRNKIESSTLPAGWLCEALRSS